MAGIPTDGIGHYAHIVAMREGLTDRLSPGARHQALPTLYAKPVPMADPAAVFSADNAKLRSENKMLRLEMAVLRAQIEMLKAVVPPEAVTPRPAGTVAGLIDLAAAITGASAGDIRGSSRARHVAWPRHFAMWLVRQARWDLSLPQLGRHFGGRDHTTLMHGLKNVAKYREMSPFAGWIADERTQAVLAGKKGEAT